MSWPTVKLGDVTFVKSGGGAPQDANDFSNSGTCFIRAGSLPKLLTGSTENDLEKISEEVAKKHKLKKFQPNAVLFAKSGMSATKGHVYKTKCEAYVVNHLAVLECKNEITAQYLYYALLKFSPTTLVLDPAYPSIRLADIEEFTIPLPPLAEQKRIAAILDKADEIKRKREQAIAKLDQLAQSIFVEMFGDALINEKCFVIINLKELAERIQIGPFGSQLHEEDYIEGGIPLINPTHIKLGKIQPDVNLTISKEKFDQLSQYHLILGDVIIGRRGEMGRCAIVTGKENGWFCGTGSLFVRLKQSKILPEYFSRTISSKSMRKHLENVSQGVTMANLNKDIIGNLLIPLPPLALQEQFATRISKLEKLKASNIAALEKHNQLFASLQNQAFTGQL